jgi:hypothetical protein
LATARCPEVEIIFKRHTASARPAVECAKVSYSGPIGFQHAFYGDDRRPLGHAEAVDVLELAPVRPEPRANFAAANGRVVEDRPLTIVPNGLPKGSVAGKRRIVLPALGEQAKPADRRAIWRAGAISLKRRARGLMK